MYNNTRYPKDQIMAKLDLFLDQNDNLCLRYNDGFIYNGEAITQDILDLFELNSSSDISATSEVSSGLAYHGMSLLDSDDNLILHIPYTVTVSRDYYIPNIFVESLPVGYQSIKVDCDGGSLEFILNA